MIYKDFLGKKGRGGEIVKLIVIKWISRKEIKDLKIIL